MDENLEEADIIACEVLNELRITHRLPQLMLVMAIIYGRLKHEAIHNGADPSYVDNLFLSHANIVLRNLTGE